jgi:hypothetical protein
MFLWLVGLVSSISLLLLVSGSGAFLVTLPLWLLGAYFFWHATQYQEDNADLFCVTTLLVTTSILLNLTDVFDTTMTLVSVHVIVICALLVYIVRDHATYDTPSEKYANWASKVSFFVAFILFYGAEVQAVERWVPLIPSVTFVLSEAFIIYSLDQRANLNMEFRERMRRERVASLIAIIVLIVLIVLHLLYVFESTTLYVAGIVVYGAGLVYICRKTIRKRYQEIQQGNDNSKKLTAGDTFIDA